MESRTDYTFLEAVKRLSDGSCKEMADMFGNVFVLNEDGVVVCKTMDEQKIYLSSAIYLGNWYIKKVRKSRVIKNVVWKKEENIVYPVFFSIWQKAIWGECLNKPDMKMTLRWNEEKKYTFLEALKKLKDGETEEISPDGLSSTVRYSLNKCRILSLSCLNAESITDIEDLNKWVLLPKEIFNQERVIGKVRWLDSEFAVYPCNMDMHVGIYWNDFLKRPPMEMFLEWEE